MSGGAGGAIGFTSRGEATYARRASSHPLLPSRLLYHGPVHEEEEEEVEEEEGGRVGGDLTGKCSPEMTLKLRRVSAGASYDQLCQSSWPLHVI